MSGDSALHGDRTKEDEQKFNRLVIKAKQLASEGNVREALELNEHALQIYHSEKLAKRIGKMKEYLKEYADVDEDDCMTHVGNGFYLYTGLYKKLYTHQIAGVLWLWGLYKQGKGGILGDDMGLGKTIQIVSFISGMCDAEKVKSVLIVLPVAVIVHWQREFTNWAPGIRVSAYHSGSKKEQERILSRVQRKGGVCLTSYGMLTNHAEQFATAPNSGRFLWDYVILDEGHKIKNPGNKCAKGAHAVPARNRIILTGTPLANNLKEMWALFDWTHKGTLLGKQKTFGMEYEQPITRARQKDATAGQMRLGQEMASSLQKLISPYFLRRTKEQLEHMAAAASKSTETKQHVMPSMKRKNDLVCWVFLSEIQQTIYTGFVNTPEIRELLNTTRSPLVALTVLKKICDHPRLLNNKQCVQLGLHVDDELFADGQLLVDVESESAANRLDTLSSQTLVAESGKMVFLVGLLDELKARGHRCLVFSQSRRVLDMISKVITERGHRVMRLDGTIRQLAEREEIIDKFTKDMSVSVFLLTTQVGGVGLTLTAADRVIIFDPSWNPATDAQAVDRAFRIGQDKDVVVYRLITCGSVEEKIYRRQIFKNSITKQTTGDSKNPYRYFSKQELHELFVLDNTRASTTQQQLEGLHGGQQHTDTSLDQHIAFLHSLDMYGISHHDLMFSQDAVPHADTVEDGAFIQTKVANAQRLLNLECEDNRQMSEHEGGYLGPMNATIEKEKKGEPKKYTPMVQTVDYGIQPLGPPASAAATQHRQLVDLTRIASDDDDDDNDDAAQLDVSMKNLQVTTNGDRLSQQSAYHTANMEPDEHETDHSASPPQVTTISDSEDELDGARDDSPVTNHHDTEISPANDMDTSSPGSHTRVESRTSADIKRNLSPTSHTPASAPPKQRRKSVCYSPRKLLCSPIDDDNDDGDDSTADHSDSTVTRTPPRTLFVEQQSVVFSPDASEPIMQVVGHGSSRSSLSETASIDYATFSRRVALNSTVLPRDSAMDKHLIVEESPVSSPVAARGRSVIADSDEDVEQQGVGGREDSDDVVLDSDDDDGGDGRGRTVNESNGNDSIHTSQHDDVKSDVSEHMASKLEDSDRVNGETDRHAVADVDNEFFTEDEDDDGDDDKIQNEKEDTEEERMDEGKDKSSEQEQERAEENGKDEEEAEDDGEDDGEDEFEEEEEEEEDGEELTVEEQQQYVEMMLKSRSLVKEGDIPRALKYAVRALKICDSDEKAVNYALKLKRKLETQTAT